MSSTVKEYIWSSFVTFITAFIGTAIPLVNIGQPITEAVLISLGATALRAGVRAVLNVATTQGTTMSSDPNKDLSK